MSSYLCLDQAMEMDQPVNVALRFIVSIFHQESCKLILGTVESLPCKLDGQSFGTTGELKVLQDVADLGIQMSFEDGKLRHEGVELLEAGIAWPKEVFQ